MKTTSGLYPLPVPFLIELVGDSNNKKKEQTKKSVCIILDIWLSSLVCVSFVYVLFHSHCEISLEAWNPCRQLVVSVGLLARSGVLFQKIRLFLMLKEGLSCVLRFQKTYFLLITEFQGKYWTFKNILLFY